eukprot:6704234-Lingulodinium_polyedra.AAC.1
MALGALRGAPRYTTARRGATWHGEVRARRGVACPGVERRAAAPRRVASRCGEKGEVQRGATRRG